MLAVKKQMSPIKERLEQDTPLQAEYRQALKTVRELEEERDGLGIFKRKEKKQLEARISPRNKGRGAKEADDRGASGAREGGGRGPEAV